MNDQTVELQSAQKVWPTAVEMDGECEYTPAAEPPGKSKSKTRGSTQAKARDNMRMVIAWTYRWGWICPMIADHLVGRKGSGICSRLTKHGYMTETETSEGGLAGVPARVYTLTDDGVAEAEADSLVPCLMPYKTLRNHKLLKHDLAVQRALLHDITPTADRATWVCWNSDREIRSIQNTLKSPDASLRIKRDGKIVVYWYEVELTAKWERDFDEMAYRMVKMLENKPHGQFKILSKSHAILDRYRRNFEVYRREGLTLWSRNTAGKWEQLEEIYRLKDGVFERIRFIPLQEHQV